MIRFPPPLAMEALMAGKEISVKTYVVRLSGEERQQLETLIRKGKSPVRRLLKTRILLKADERAMPAVPPIFDGEKEAKLIALACSKPPKGYARWTLRLLENKVVELGIVDRASDSTIGRTLKKTL